MDENPRRMRYRQGAEEKRIEKNAGGDKVSAAKKPDDAPATEKKPGFFEMIFGKKTPPEAKPVPKSSASGEGSAKVDSQEVQTAKDKLKEAASQLAAKHLNEFKEKNQRYPSKEEMDKIAQQIYLQFEREMKIKANAQSDAEKTGAAPRGRERRGQKDYSQPDSAGKAGAQKPETRAEQRRRKRQAEHKGGEEKGKAGMNAEGAVPESADESAFSGAEAKDIDVKDLLGEGQGADIDKEISLEGLEGLDELKDMEGGLDEMHDELHITKEIETENNKCPSCGTKAEALVFCPKCGNAFCNHCAKKAEGQVDSIAYECPKCKSGFKLKK